MALVIWITVVGIFVAWFALSLAIGRLVARLLWMNDCPGGVSYYYCDNCVSGKPCFDSCCPGYRQS